MTDQTTMPSSQHTFIRTTPAQLFADQKREWENARHDSNKSYSACSAMFSTLNSLVTWNRRVAEERLTVVADQLFEPYWQVVCPELSTDKAIIDFSGEWHQT